MLRFVKPWVARQERLFFQVLMGRPGNDKALTTGSNLLVFALLEGTVTEYSKNSLSCLKLMRVGWENFVTFYPKGKILSGKMMNCDVPIEWWIKPSHLCQGSSGSPFRTIHPVVVREAGKTTIEALPERLKQVAQL